MQFKAVLAVVGALSAVTYAQPTLGGCRSLVTSCGVDADCCGGNTMECVSGICVDLGLNLGLDLGLDLNTDSNVDSTAGGNVGSNVGSNIGGNVGSSIGSGVDSMLES